MPPPIIRLASCSNFVKCCWSRRWQSVRSLASTKLSDISYSSLDTSVLRHPQERLGKFKAIETYDQLKRERSSALLFLRQLKESGYKHDLETYMTVVRLCCHWDWGMDVRSNSLLDDVIDNTNWEVVSFKISDDLFKALMEEKLVKAVDGLVEVYARAGRFKEAIHTLSELKSRGGLVVSTQTCNYVLKKLLEWGKVDMIDSVYGQMKRDGLIPNAYTYGILIKGHCVKGCFKGAWDVFEQMEEAGVEPNAFTYGTYFHALCLKGKTDLAFQAVKNLWESNKPVYAFAYACVIRGFVKESKLQDAVDVLHDMKVREVVPDADCYRFLIQGYCEKGDLVKALDLCKEMESSGIKFDHVFVRFMMHSLCGWGKLDEALYVFKHLMRQSRVFLDGVSFKIAIDAACKLGKVDEVMGLVEEMKGRKIKPLVMQALGNLEPTGTNQ